MGIEDKYPKTGLSRNAIKANKSETERRVAQEGQGISMGTNYPWSIYDSNLKDFAANFVTCLPRTYIDNADYETAFKSYIENTLALSAHNHALVGVEFGGPGSQLFEGFSTGFFKKTFGVCLTDPRTGYKYGKKEDVNMDHNILEGDIFNTKKGSVYDQLISCIGTKKIDLIVSKMEGPLNYISKEPTVLEHTVRKWYSLLEENGIMLVQLEYTPNINPVPVLPLQVWIIKVREKFPDIEIQLALNGRVIRIHKKEGAPEVLPSASQLFK